MIDEYKIERGDHEPGEVFQPETQADSCYAREISLFAENDGRLFHQMTEPYIHNLARKMARGEYDQFKAMKGWRAVADEATRLYSVDLCGYAKPTLTICNVATRNLVAVEIAESYMELLEEYAAEETAKRNFKPDQKALVARFLAEIAPGIPRHDKAMIREEFHIWKDGLCRSGEISEYLCQYACLPARFQ